MACTIEHHTTITKAWFVGNSHGRQGYVGPIGLHGQRLTQCLNAIEHACRRACGDCYLLVVHTKAIGFGTRYLGIDG